MSARAPWRCPRRAAANLPRECSGQVIHTRFRGHCPGDAKHSPQTQTQAPKHQDIAALVPRSSDMSVDSARVRGRRAAGSTEMARIIGTRSITDVYRIESSQLFSRKRGVPPFDKLQAVRASFLDIKGRCGCCCRRCCCSAAWCASRETKTKKKGDVLWQFTAIVLGCVALAQCSCASCRCQADAAVRGFGSNHAAVALGPH